MNTILLHEILTNKHSKHDSIHQLVQVRVQIKYVVEASMSVGLERIDTQNTRSIIRTSVQWMQLTNWIF
jgi:hypothetical protein